MADVFGESLTDLDIKLPETEGIVEERDPLKLDLPDDELIKVINDNIAKSRRYFKTQDLYSRRKKNLSYYLGTQVQSEEDDEPKYADNIIWETGATLKSIALSKIPDLMVKPGNNTEESRKAAEQLTEVINNELRKRENRTVLSRVYKHRPIYFVGCIKYRWDKERGKNGDYVFECINPDNIDVDHTANSNNVDDMDWIAHHYELSVKECLIQFPDKKDELLKALGYSPDDARSEKKLATKIKISEVWFKWYVRRNKNWSCEYAVLWKYEDVILKKMKNPNWDWEGEEYNYRVGEDGKESPVPEEEIRNAFFTGLPVDFQSKNIFHNHLSQPEFPFILVGYDQLGLQPMDETSWIEQLIPLQDDVNERGDQIQKLIRTSRGIDVFSSESGAEKKDIEQIDMNDDKQYLYLKGDISKVYTRIPGVLPAPALFQEQANARERAFAKAGAHATTRGEREAEETATGRQILREGDFTKQDDEVSETINYAAERMANAAMQMIKLRYTEEHLKRMIGKDGKIIFAKVKRDLVEDGMEVEVSASSVDKMLRKKEAYERAKMKMTDPLTFFQDTDVPNPTERTERLMLFIMSPPQYMAKYVMGMENTQQMVGALGQQPAPGVPQPPVTQPTSQVNPQQFMMDLALLQEGQMPTGENITPEYLEQLNQYILTPEFRELNPEVQSVIRSYAQKIINSYGGQGGQPT